MLGDTRLQQAKSSNEETLFAHQHKTSLVVYDGRCFIYIRLAGRDFPVLGWSFAHDPCQCTAPSRQILFLKFLL